MYHFRMETETPRRKSLRADVDLELAKAVQAAAQREHRSIAGWVRHVLVERLEGDDDQH